jgi:hypothetical protein
MKIIKPLFSISFIFIYLSCSNNSVIIINTHSSHHVEMNGKCAIVGKIFSKESPSLPGAHIKIINLQFKTISDINGYYTFSNLEPGDYKIRCDYMGYFSQTSESIKIDENSIFVLNFYLHRAPIY